MIYLVNFKDFRVYIHLQKGFECKQKYASFFLFFYLSIQMSQCITPNFILLALPLLSLLLLFSPLGWSHEGLGPGCHLYRESYCVLAWVTHSENLYYQLYYKSFPKHISLDRSAYLLLTTGGLWFGSNYSFIGSCIISLPFPMKQQSDKSSPHQWSPVQGFCLHLSAVAIYLPCALSCSIWLAMYN